MARHWRDEREFGLITATLPDHGGHLGERNTLAAERLRVEFDGKIYHFM